MTPLTYYQQLLDKEQILVDQQQQAAVSQLDLIFHHLVERHQRSQYGFFRWVNKLKKKPPVMGLYLWGGVGIGKTFLMDIFYRCLPFPQKQRLHFHRFMAFIHDELKTLEGQKNPLKTIAKRISAKTELLCFDEFFVKDIADAMLLGGLLQALFDAGVCLIATSNLPPEKLYERGLQREQFLPAIAALKQNLTIIAFTENTDYRRQSSHKSGIYFSSDTEETTEKMEKTFNARITENTIITGPVMILGREILAIKHADRTIWFNFKALCSIPRCQRDYLQLAKDYDTIFVSHITPMLPEHHDLICNFIAFIDVCYDANITLILQAETPIDALYTKGRQQFDFLRTQSRLYEMQ